MIKGIIFDWVGTLYKRNTGLFSDSVNVLETLKPRYKLGLVSLAGQGIPQRIEDIKETGIWDYFDSIVINTEKEKKQFLQCINEMGTTPKSTLVVGDRTIREIRVGNQLGCKTYWIQKGDYANQPPTKETGKPTGTIKNLKDILKFL
tara:strand:- start:1167 stop:1607 length:441 start_codon:yes stop_codon:yes gene_type:complete